MTACRCTDVKHPEHSGHLCERIATEADGYCQACHDHARRHKAQAAPAFKNPGTPRRAAEIR
jgi:hypothetical protein